MSQNSQENTCARVSFLLKKRLWHKFFSCELCEVFKNTSGGFFWIDLSEQKTLDVDPKPTQQISFRGNRDQDVDTMVFLIIEKLEEFILDFSQGNVKALWIYFALI